MIATQDEAEKIRALKIFLADNWATIKGSRLSYTAIPNAGVTDILCDVAEYVAARLNTGETPVGSFHVLMPDVLFENPGFGGYGPLAPYKSEIVRGGRLQEVVIKPQDFNLRKVLNTHVLDVTGRCLIPVRVILDKADDAGKIAKPYFDHEKLLPSYLEKLKFVSEHFSKQELLFQMTTMSVVSEEEYSRIFMHSSYTMVYKEAQVRLAALTSGSNDLYQQLAQLSKFLILHSSHGGIGKDGAASFGAYTAIVAFMDFYTSLPEEAQNQIPASVKAAIEHIQNANGDCVGSLGEGLREAIKPEDVKSHLRAIGQDDKSRQELIKKAEEELQKAKQSLEKALLEGYEGVDNLAINLALLEKYNVQVVINGLRDIHAIAMLSENEIRNISAGQDIKRGIIQAIRSIEDLVVFSIETPTNKLDVLLQLIATEISKSLLKEPQDLMAWLVALPQEKKEIILKNISGEVLNIVDRQGKTILHFAAENEPNLFNAILDSFGNNNPAKLAAVTKEDGAGSTAIYFAAQNAECFKIALDLFGDDNQSKLAAVTKENKYGATAIHKAAQNAACFKIALDSLNAACFKIALDSLLLDDLKKIAEDDKYKDIKERLEKYISEKEITERPAAGAGFRPRYD